MDGIRDENESKKSKAEAEHMNHQDVGEAGRRAVWRDILLSLIRRDCSPVRLKEPPP